MNHVHLNELCLETEPQQSHGDAVTGARSPPLPSRARRAELRQPRRAAGPGRRPRQRREGSAAAATPRAHPRQTGGKPLFFPGGILI